VQRRHRKLIEIAPSPSLSVRLREEIIDAAVRVAKAAGYHSLGTIEFLLDEESQGDFVFIEANARLQVEHTATEEVHGVDLVQAQLRIAGGATLAELGVNHALVARGYAIQARVNLERMEPDGNVRPAGGMLTLYEPPAGPGVRVDGYGYAGYATNANFDSLLAKVVVHSSSEDFRDAVKRCERALAEFEIGGVETNLPFLRNVVAHGDFSQGLVYTRWLATTSQSSRRSMTRPPTLPRGATARRVPTSICVTPWPRWSSIAKGRALGPAAPRPRPRSPARPTLSRWARRCRAP